MTNKNIEKANTPDNNSEVIKQSKESQAKLQNKIFEQVADYLSEKILNNYDLNNEADKKRFDTLVNMDWTPSFFGTITNRLLLGNIGKFKPVKGIMEQVQSIKSMFENFTNNQSPKEKLKTKVLELLHSDSWKKDVITISLFFKNLETLIKPDTDTKKALTVLATAIKKNNKKLLNNIHTGTIGTKPLEDVVADNNNVFDDNTDKNEDILYEESSKLLNIAEETIKTAPVKSYEWGKRSPETGFDCSGFIDYSFREAIGKSPGATSREQFKNLYDMGYIQSEPILTNGDNKINKDILSKTKPGDLIFWHSIKGDKRSTKGPIPHTKIDDKDYIIHHVAIVKKVNNDGSITVLQSSGSGLNESTIDPKKVINKKKLPSELYVANIDWNNYTSSIPLVA